MRVVADSNAPQLANHRARIIYSCRSRALRCDDVQRMCLVEDDDYATGYNAYDYEPISIHGFPPGRRAGRGPRRGLAPRARRGLPPAPRATPRVATPSRWAAFMTASISLGMMLRFVEPDPTERGELGADSAPAASRSRSRSRVAGFRAVSPELERTRLGECAMAVARSGRVRWRACVAALARPGARRDRSPGIPRASSGAFAGAVMQAVP